MKTKRILTSQATPGMIVADDIYTFNNQMIIAKGSRLTNRAITRLKFYSINDIRIEYSEEEASGSVEAPAPDMENQNQKAKEAPGSQNKTPAPAKTASIDFQPLGEFVKQTQEYKQFHTEYENTLKTFEEKINHFVYNRDQPINTHTLLEEVNSILRNRRNGMHLFHMLQSMRDYQDETYAHSISVALICNAMGNWLRYAKSDIETLTLCGLLHDLGKAFIPKDILTKKGDLTGADISILKTHPIQGYNALKPQAIDVRIKHSVLMHHERCDGSGYPNQLIGPMIDDFAKIVAIADTYDAMTSPRIYRGSLCPFEVIHLFQSEGLTKYDPFFLLTFLKGTADTFLHREVTLSNGMEGEIVIINQSDLSRPVVRVGEQYINLFREPAISIVSVR